MSIDLTLEQACVKIGVEGDLLMGLAGVSVQTGLAFKLISEIKNAPEETNTYLVGNTDNQKAKVEIVFTLGKGKISSASVTVTSMPDSGSGEVLVPTVLLKTEPLKGNYQFGEIIIPLTARILKEISAKLENTDLDFDSKKWSD